MNLTTIDYKLMNEMVAGLTASDNLYEALFTISAAVAEDLTDAPKVLLTVIEAINRKFYYE